MNYPVIKLYQQHLIVYVKPFSVRVVYEEVGSNKLFSLRTSDFGPSNKTFKLKGNKT